MGNTPRSASVMTGVLGHLLVIVSTAALFVTLVIPGYCLVLTPGHAAHAVTHAFELYGAELPPMSQACFMMPKAVMIMTWLALVGMQAILWRLAKPCWLAIVGVAGQAVVAAVASYLFMYWHIGCVHLPALKLLNDLSP